MPNSYSLGRDPLAVVTTQFSPKLGKTKPSLFRTVGKNWVETRDYRD